MKKTISKQICIILSAVMLLLALPVTVYADGEAEAIEVYTEEDLNAAVSKANRDGGKYVISLQENISGSITVSNSNTEITLVGNGNTLSSTSQIVHVENGAKVHLGDGISSLTLKGGEYNDIPGIVYVLYGSYCDMRDNVTITDRIGENYLGGGVSVEGGTFHMYGGTIQNCGIVGGSVCYGGGVAVYNSGSFTMDNGTIKDCYVTNSTGSDYGWQVPFAAGGGVFVCRANFTMNGGTIEHCYATNTEIDSIDNPDAIGGGVAVITSLDSYFDNANKYGYLDSNFNMNGGTIKNCSATMCGGALAAGTAYVHNEAIGTQYRHTEGADTPRIFLNGGTMAENEANDGGAIFLNWIRPSIPVDIKNMNIIKNRAYQGAGIEVLSFYTEANIDHCTITENNADSFGGGIFLNQSYTDGTIPSETTLKDTVIKNNTSGNRGAGIYYNKPSHLTISGANTIQENTINGKLNNVNVLSKDYPLYIGGDLAGSKIGLSDPTLWDDGKEDTAPEAISTEYLTSGYKEYNPEMHPSKYFTSDHESWIVDRSAKATTTTPDPNSKTYREYTVKRYPVIPSPYSYAGHYQQYVITDIQNPALTDISTNNDIISELKYRFEESGNYNITDSSNPNVGSTYIKYTPKDSDSLLSSIVLQKSPNKNEITIAYNANRNQRNYGGNVTYTASLSIQSNYANAGELVFQITSNGDNALINNPTLYNFNFSDNYTETTVKYINADPPGNVLFEYDENGDVTAKLVPVSYEEKTAQITVETGTDREVRLVRKKVNYHINNSEIDDKYGNDDIFTDEVEAATGKAVKYGETINSFYAVPEVSPTAENSCPYIFKGWYYDPVDEDEPVKFDTDIYTKDIYAHWIQVGDVAKDAEDDKSFTDGETKYGGFDLAGVQIRDEGMDLNRYEWKPRGMRYVTSLSMDVVEQINAIKPNNIEYGYVAATNKDWINYHKSVGSKLLYNSTNSNGTDTSDAAENNKDYFGFAKNINCTSRAANPKGKVGSDHRNYSDYLLYTLVITYEDEGEEGYGKDVLARPYIKYTDANNLVRVAYSEYRGNSNVIGGCYTNYTFVSNM